MSSFQIKTFPDSVLRKISEPVHKVDKSIHSFVERLINFMYCQPGGIGIAAPQVGVLKQIAIVDLTKKVPGSELLVLINPQITFSDQYEVSREGCMSLPDYTANIKRAAQIRVKWQDLALSHHEMSADGLLARCIQHEVDHLNGMLFVDRAVSLKSDVFPRKRYL